MAKWIKLPKSLTCQLNLKVRSLNPKFADQFRGKWQFVVVWLVTPPNLSKPYVILCQCKFQGHG